MKRVKNHSGFTLLELLAAVTLLVMLGSLLFQVFGQASTVVCIGSGRQEVFEYARALFETFRREVTGVIGVRNAGPEGQGTPFRLSSSEANLTVFEQTHGVEVREGSDAISLTAGLVGRDGLPSSPTLGNVASVAHVAYWLTAGNNTLNRRESYNIVQPAAGRGWEFALNVLEFQIAVLDERSGGMGFERKDWDSSVTASDGLRRGLPEAVRVTIKLTDGTHVDLYAFDPVSKRMVPKPRVRVSDDPVVQEFSQVMRIRKE